MRLFISFCLLLVTSGYALADTHVGAMLYKKNCIACHGADGKGGVGVPLALESFQAQASDRFLKNTIRFGRVGRVMPAFKSLGDDELNALVAYIRTFANATPPVYSQQPIRANAKHGATLFSENCAACHGDHGQGGKGTGVTFSRPRDLPIIAPALNNEGFLKSASDAMIQATLRQGREGTPMVSFLDHGMSEQDINDVVAYIRTFEKNLPTRTNVEDEPYYLEVESSLSFEQTVESLKQAVIGENYRLIRTQKFDYGLVKVEQEDAKKVVVYFCNFKLLNEALTVDPRVGLFLPCRLTVVEHKGKVRIMAINPLHLSHFFNNDELNNLCKGMRETYEVIMEGATL
ncbi:Cytochrome c family protein [hydrothermal vent metagenome]|uniref:Cytochrome c family protein n=1 Tax=hydrothermal vent metagenome TaxID=652676 RepID=A0A3B1ACL4_9ZZZZ